MKSFDGMRMKNDSGSRLLGGSVKLNQGEFLQLSSFIYEQFGIKLPPAKKVMLEGRLQKRLRINNFSSFKEYLELLFSKQGRGEMIHMIDAVSTNKTDFFRESGHFDFLIEHVLPEFIGERGHQTLKIWSSASSSGEEPYTIAMCIEEFNSTNSRMLNYSILGTDISVEILDKAADAVYNEDRIANIPLSLKRKYFLRNKDKALKLVRVTPALRNKVRYKRLNLMDNVYSVPEKYDVIFCRNVLIYFDKATQEKVINKLCENLKVGGLLFLGHSESIIGQNIPVTQIKPAIYKKNQL